MRMLLGSSILLFLGLNWIFPLQMDIPYSQLILSTEDEVMGAYLSEDDKWRLFLEKEEITPLVEEAFLLKEDRFFYWHPGVNPVSVVRALFRNLQQAKRTSGASTITMQVARMLDPKARSYSNKVIEMFRAFQLELRFSKKEILRLYLNLAPYGGNIEGIKSASFLYLGKLPATLSPSEIAMLTVIPNRPNSIGFKGDRNELFAEKNRWLRYFQERGWIESETLADALKEQIQAKRRSISFTAPHLCRRLHQSHPRQAIVRTHISMNLQQKGERLVHQYIERLKYRAISNAAALIIENESGKVMSYIGSADFNDLASQGKVDGVQAVRSPGSTLKPFLYALAFEQGLATPNSTVNDVPLNLGGYSPENYDLKYNGRVSISYALAQSLNIPAVKTLHQTGVLDFIELLGKGGMESIKADRKDLGLSMILGGCGVRLEEMANLYRTLANQGMCSNLNFTKASESLLRFQLIDPSACFMTSKILQELDRPDFPSDWKYGSGAPEIAWKTGTSYGRRDAWSIGYNSKYTVAVWVGNFDGTGVPDLSGAEVATPLLFELFGTLPGASIENWLKPSQKIDLRKVCSNTGLKPSQYCTDIVFDHFIPGVSPYQTCNCRQLIWLNETEDTSFCNSCRGDRKLHQSALLVLPPDLLRYYENTGMAYEKIPVHQVNCTRIFQDDKPRITNPTNGAEYLLEKGSGQKLSFTADVAADVKKIYWYANDRYLGHTSVGKNFLFEAKPGELKISCADDKGRSSSIKVLVKHY